MAVAVMAARPLSMMEVDKEDHAVPEAQETIDFVTMGMFIIGKDAIFFFMNPIPFRYHSSQFDVCFVRWSAS